MLGIFSNSVQQRATVRFAIPDGTEATDLTMRLYDVLGRQVHTVRAEAKPGRHEQTLDVSRLPSGVYVLQLRGGANSASRN